MTRPAKRTTVCVVDPQPDDYTSLDDHGARGNRKVNFHRSGREALRASLRHPQENPDVWMINTKLPDMSGVDLQSMLQSHCPGVPVYLVGDNYSSEEEIAARGSGATMYFNKPVQSEWLLDEKVHAET